MNSLSKLILIKKHTILWGKKSGEFNIISISFNIRPYSEVAEPTPHTHHIITTILILSFHLCLALLSDPLKKILKGSDDGV
jgi:hypothetical protein